MSIPESFVVTTISPFPTNIFECLLSLNKNDNLQSESAQYTSHNFLLIYHEQ